MEQTIIKRNTALRQEKEIYELMLKIEKNGARKNIIKKYLDLVNREMLTLLR